jgi:hypothetical protein
VNCGILFLSYLLKILSDSQQSIGILTLNWKSQSYFNVIKEIKAKMETLQQSGMRIEQIFAAFFGYVGMVFKVASTSVGVFPLMLPFFWN